jgi:DNA-binding HxlR family transcriptional regulator
MITIPEPPIVSARTGVRLLRGELNRASLDALRLRPTTVSELCAYLMLESETTLREQLDELEVVGAIARKADDGGRAGELRLTHAGRDLLAAMTGVAAWLTARPGRSLRPESDAAWRAFAAFGEAWELSLIQHLLVRPSTRAELMTTVPSLGREKAKRILRRLRGAGILRSGGAGAGRRYALTVWARRAIAFLAAIAAWERRYLGPRAEPVAACDGAVALLATLPLIHLPVPASGICTFTVEVGPSAPGPAATAVWARVAGGRVTACRSGSPSRPPTAWVRGDVDAWLGAVIDARIGALHLGGGQSLAEGVVRGLHEELFGTARPH